MIIDKIMDFFSQEDKLMVEDGGQKVELFGPGNENAYKIGDDFDTIIRSLLNDEKGGKIHSKLVESGNINQLEDLWKMGGSPSLEYNDSGLTLPSDPNSPKATYTPPSKDRAAVTTIHSGYEYDSQTKFNAWIAELSHGIGYHNPSMMKISQKEYRDKTGKLQGVNTMEPTLEFISALGSFPEPQSPQDSLASYRDWRKNLPPEIPRKGGHTIKGSPENITHAQIESALHWWLQDNLDIPFQDRSLWGYEEE